MEVLSSSPKKKKKNNTAQPLLFEPFAPSIWKYIEQFRSSIFSPSLIVLVFVEN